MCCVSLLLYSSFLPFCSPLILLLLFSRLLSLCLFVDTSGRVSRSRLPASMFEHASDGPGSQHTDTEDHAQCAVRALSPCLALLSPHVCVTAKRLVSLRRLAHAAGHWYLFLLFHLYPHGFLCLIVSAETWVSSVRVATLVFRPFKRQRGIKQNSRRDMCVQVPCERS